MKIKKITKTQSGAFFLQGLMVLFIFFSSCTPGNAQLRPSDNHLKIRALFTDPIVFRDSNLSESISQLVAKVQLTDYEFETRTLDVNNISVALTDAFSIRHFTFNSFYHHVTINAP